MAEAVSKLVGPKRLRLGVMLEAFLGPGLSFDFTDAYDETTRWSNEPLACQKDQLRRTAANDSRVVLLEIKRVESMQVNLIPSTLVLY